MDGVVEAAELLAGRTAVVLTGAGISTDSGIPDYRGDGAPRRSPMTYSDFLSGDDARRRYWARSHLGWRRVATAEPNAGHRALATMESAGAVRAVITQNVDGLHQRAGSRDVVELHGRLADVICLDCGYTGSREALQQRLSAMNQEFDRRPVEVDQRPVEAAPDGDVALDDVDGFATAACEDCDGVLKPDVVFFGEAVPPARVERCLALTDAAEALIVAGSSLAVLSGYRFVRHAHQRGIPIVIINRGPTRADEMATVKLELGCSEALSELAVLLVQ